MKKKKAQIVQLPLFTPDNGRRCARCRVVFGADGFYADGKRGGYCKACQREYQKTYWQANRETILERQRKPAQVRREYARTKREDNSLARLRVSQGFTQDGIAKAIGIPAGTYKQLERGVISPCGNIDLTPTALKVIAFWGLKPEEVFAPPTWNLTPKHWLRKGQESQSPALIGSGRIYFIRAGESGPIKIGFTTGQPEARITKLQTAHFERLRLLGSMPGTPMDERRLHVKFAAERLNGEWFLPSDALMNLIASITGSPQVSDSSSAVQWWDS